MLKKKAKIKKQNIIIFLNIVILLAITCFYAVRLVHYYKIEHPKITKKTTISEAITLKKNITEVGDGLYKTDTTYLFKGTEVDNYLKYSGYLFRIVSVDESGNIKLITEDSLTNLVWGLENYNNSYIKTWLNGKGEHEGIFYNSLNSPENYLTDTSFCVSELTEKSKKCEEETTETVGLLSLLEYKKAGGSKSYLNTDNYWWFSTPSSSGVWYAYSDGEIADDINQGNEYYSYGVRPVITLKGDLTLISGDGTLENPYTVEEETENVLKNKNVGSYLSYSDQTWRIIEKSDNYIRVALNGFVKEKETDYERVYSNDSTIFSPNREIGYYLNNTFYEQLDATYMVEGTVYTNRYDNTVDFDYRRIFDNEISAKVGMMQVGDLFMNDYYNYFLVSRTSTYEGTVYKVMKDNMLYADLPTEKAKIRPTIFLDLEAPIKSGSGTLESPYVIGK